MEKNSERRGNYFINKSFQVKFVLRFVILLTLGLIVSAGLLYVLSNKSISANMGYGHYRTQISNTFDMLLPNVIITTAASLLIVSILGIVLFIRYSHRLAGPLYRFEKTAERISQGDLTDEIRLRNSDEMVELGDSLTNMTKQLNKQITDIKRETADLSEVAKDLGSSLSDSSSQESKELTEKLIKLINEMKGSVDFFKV